MLFAKFYDRLIKTNETNPKTGLPQFKEVCFVEIRIKNNMTDIVDQPATQEKIRQFPAEYQLYLKSKENLKEGTALNLFAYFSPKDVATLNAHGIFSIEAFIALSKEKVIDLGLLSEWEKAKHFLKVLKNDSLVYDLEQKIKLLEEEIKVLKEQSKSTKTASSTVDLPPSKKRKSRSQKSLSKACLTLEEIENAPLFR